MERDPAAQRPAAVSGMIGAHAGAAGGGRRADRGIADAWAVPLRVRGPVGAHGRRGADGRRLRPGARRPGAARHGRPGRLPGAAGARGRADHRDQRAVRRGRPGGGARDRRRRLRHQTVRGARGRRTDASGPQTRTACPARTGGAGAAAHRPARTAGAPRRCRGGADAEGVRPAGVPRRGARRGVHPRADHGGGVGRELVRPHQDAGRARGVLRRKLGDAASLETVRGVGFRLVLP